MISKLSFNIVDTHDFKTLGIVDTSWYNPDIEVEAPKIEIIPPGFTIAASPFFMTQALNIYNSNTVGLTKVTTGEELIDLPDGLWKIKYSICPNDKLFIERFFLKTDRIQCKFTQAFLNLDLSNLDADSELKKRKSLENIELFIQGAVAASNNQDAKLASDLYKKADVMLNTYIANYQNGICKC